jgi:hypothetical protein
MEEPTVAPFAGLLTVTLAREEVEATNSRERVKTKGE